MQQDQYVGLDFETYASTDLLKHGLHRYINCPDFTPLLAAVVWVEGSVTQRFEGRVFDFVEDYEGEKAKLVDLLSYTKIVAHNAGFEQAVLGRMGIDIPSSRFVDSAVLARSAGAAGKLEAAAPQLLGTDKLAVGYELIKLFSIPGQYQVDHHSMAFNPKIRVDYMTEWAKFAEYCAIDAELSLRLAGTLLQHVSAEELANNAVTMDMNNTGWHVDLGMVEVMQRRFLANVQRTVEDFRTLTGAVDLNLNSHPQLLEWCAKRGVRASSFDEAHVAKLIRSLDKRLESSTLDSTKRGNYIEVRAMLLAKQAMGGSSLKKLATILDTVGDDGRLHDQYLHCGAGATYRTTGRGVQMQNLKRLNGQGDDMAELLMPDTEWDNGKLASNLRQVFTATDTLGQLIVGDFSSVESRGLAWQAGEQWKLKAYAKGEDLYKVQAALMFGIDPSHVNKEQRQIGKVAELACGYGAGADAVKDFAEKMGVTLSEGESAKLVKDWRAANPQIVEYWQSLDDILHHALRGVHASTVIPHGRVQIEPFLAPDSLRTQVGDEKLLSLRIKLILHDNTEVLNRVIHGVHEVGRSIQYWKPSERKTGDLWTDTFMDPKTKRQRPYTVYGGKLAGLLTQSLCREVFFTSLRQVHEWCAHHTNVKLVGQFHDEIVLDWEPQPGAARLAQVKDALQVAMTHTILPEFPLAADIKSDYRYTK